MLNRHRRGQSGEPLKKAQPALQPRVRVAIDWELRRQGAARVWGKQPQALSTAPGGPSCVALLSSDISVYRAPVLAYTGSHSILGMTHGPGRLSPLYR